VAPVSLLALLVQVPSCRNRCVDAGALEALVAVLLAQPAAADTARAACAGIASLAAGNEARAQAAVDAGALPALAAIAMDASHAAADDAADCLRALGRNPKGGKDCAIA